MKNRRISNLLSAAALLAVSGAASAIPISGNGPLGDFTGSLTVSVIDDDEASLTVVLNNALTTLPGGKITGFVLNNPDGKITQITSYTSTIGAFQQLGLSNNGVSGAPNGDFDFGAALGGNFLGGGSPNAGIAVGGSATFTFGLKGANVDTLTGGDFLSALSSGSNKPEAMEVRFRGFANGGSDKVPAIPEPETYAMMLAGLGVLALSARRRRKA